MNSFILRFAPRAITWTIFATLFFSPLIFSPASSELFEVPKMFFVYFAAAVVATVWLLFSLASGKFTLAKTPLSLPLLAFLLSVVVSTIFSIDRFTSVFGYPTRANGGLLSILSYLVFFGAVATFFDKSQVYRAVSLILGSAALVSLIGIPGHFGYDPLCMVLTGHLNATCWQAEFQPTLRIFSTFGQPNWLAAYLTMALPLSLGAYLSVKKWRNQIIFLGLFALLLAAFIFTNSRSGLLGLGAGAVVFIILTARRSLSQNRKRPIAAALVTLVLFAVFGGFLTSRVKEFFAKNRLPLPTSSGQTAPAGPALEVGGTESGKIRFIVWKGAVEIWRHHPIIGSGVETFAYSYYRYRPVEHNQTTEWNFLYNKAHNEFLNYLANQGLVGLFSYLAIIVAVAWFALKEWGRLESIGIGLVSGFIGVAAAQFFGFSVVVTNLLFFVFPSLLFVLEGQKGVYELDLKSPLSKFAGLKPVAYVAVSGTGIYLLIAIYSMFLADQSYDRARQFLALGAVGPAQSLIEKAYDLSFARNPSYLVTRATIEAERATIQGQDQTNLTKRADADIKKALERSPNNVNFVREASAIYLLLSEIDPSYNAQALRAARRAVELSPTDPAIHLNLYQVLQKNEATDEAKKVLDETLKLKPDYPDALDAREASASG